MRKTKFEPLKECFKDDENFMCMTVLVPKSSEMTNHNDGRLIDDPHMDDVIAITYHQLNPPAGQNIEIEQARDYSRLFAQAPQMYHALQEAREELDCENESNSHSPLYNDRAALIRRIDEILAKVDSKS